MLIKKPEENTYDSYYKQYVDLVPTTYLEAELQTNFHEMSLFLLNMEDSKWNYQYAEGKWTVSQVLMHIIDVEHMFCNRIMNMVRGLKTDLESFDDNLMAENAVTEKITPKRFIDLYNATRNYTFALARTLTKEDWDKSAHVEGKPFTVRSLYYCIIGHERHHMSVVKSKYM